MSHSSIRASSKQNLSEKAQSENSCITSIPAILVVAFATSMILVLVAVLTNRGGETSESESLMAHDPCVCPMIYAPVCTIHNETFASRCQADCLGQEIAHDGECVLPNECKSCSSDYVPVCGSDKKTYLNECIAACSRVEILRQGMCSKRVVDKLPGKRLLRRLGID